MEGRKQASYHIGGPLGNWNRLSRESRKRFPFLHSSGFQTVVPAPATRELVRDANDQASLQTKGIRNPGGEVQPPILTSPPGDSDARLVLRATALATQQEGHLAN